MQRPCPVCGKPVLVRPTEVNAEVVHLACALAKTAEVRARLRPLLLKAGRGVK